MDSSVETPNASEDAFAEFSRGQLQSGIEPPHRARRGRSPLPRLSPRSPGAAHHAARVAPPNPGLPTGPRPPAALPDGAALRRESSAGVESLVTVVRLPIGTIARVSVTRP